MRVTKELPEEGRIRVETASGQTLTLCKAGRYVLQDILVKLGFANAGEASREAVVERLAKADTATTATEAMRWFSYCAGYGVVDDPSPEALTELRALGFEVGSKAVARANWLKVMVLQDEQEAALLAALVTGLTFGAGRLVT